MTLGHDPFDTADTWCYCGMTRLEFAAVGDDPPLKGFRCPACGDESLPGQVAMVYLEAKRTRQPVPQWAQWGYHTALPSWLTTYDAGTTRVTP